MRGKTILLAMLCIFLLAFGAGFLHQQTKLLEQKLARLEAEIELLEAENEYLRILLQKLKLLQEIVLVRMERWLDEWQVGEFEATGTAIRRA